MSTTPHNCSPNNATHNDEPKNDYFEGISNCSPSSVPNQSRSPLGSPNTSLLGDRIKVVVGVALGIGFVTFLLFVIRSIWSRKKRRNQNYYSITDSPLGTGSNNYNSGQHPNWQAGPDPHSGVLGAPHPLMNNDDGSSNYTSCPQAPPSLMNNDTGSSNYTSCPQPPPSLMINDTGSSNYTSCPQLPPSPNLSLTLNGCIFTFEELASATRGFSIDNVIGKGGFGLVHKGRLSNGIEVAVKSLKVDSKQGEREFRAEIDIISRVHHRHLVSLFGYCISGGKRMLVYEFVPNKTLEHHLHGEGVRPMDWPTRTKIALGSAKGLAYLHENCNPRIIHRDVKTSNILIDDTFEAKVSDFGLAKLTTDSNTHVTTRIMGTFGYLAPEYVNSGKLTEKSDVFSFGVMLLEMITGRRPFDVIDSTDTLVEWASPLMKRGLDEDGDFRELVDPFLKGKYNSQEMAKMVVCAASCIHNSAKKRPKISQIVTAFEGDVSLKDLKEGMLKWKK